MLQLVLLIAFVVLSLMGLGIIMSKHGQEKEGRYNIWLSLFTAAWTFYLLWYYYVN